MSELTYIANEDGTLSIKVDGKDVRYAKESDLLAVKGASKTKSDEWDNKETNFNSQLAEANRLRGEEHQTLLQERATLEQLQEAHKDYDTLKTKVGELETAVNTHKGSVGKYETELTNRIKANLIHGYGAKEDAVKDKDLNQLRNLEEAAKLFSVGSKAVPARYDGGPGGPSAGTAPEKPFDRAKRILEEHEAKGHRMGGKMVPAKV